VPRADSQAEVGMQDVADGGWGHEERPTAPQDIGRPCCRVAATITVSVGLGLAGGALSACYILIDPNVMLSNLAA
jgi:hypothetical protein